MKISLEFAHTDIAAIDTKEIARSAAAARLVSEYLLQEGHGVQHLVLFDDKKVNRYERETFAEPLLALLGSLGCRPDGSFYESDLMKHLSELSLALPLHQQRDLERSTRSYIRKYDSLPCSVDIALWHSLRLGLLTPEPAVAPSDVVISILGSNDEKPEQLAKTKLLDFLVINDTTKAGDCVIDLYYPEKSTDPFVPSTLIGPLSNALKEITSCLAS